MAFFIKSVIFFYNGGFRNNWRLYQSHGYERIQFDSLAIVVVILFAFHYPSFCLLFVCKLFLFFVFIINFFLVLLVRLFCLQLCLFVSMINFLASKFNELKKLFLTHFQSCSSSRSYLIDPLVHILGFLELHFFFIPNWFLFHSSYSLPKLTWNYKRYIRQHTWSSEKTYQTNIFFNLFVPSCFFSICITLYSLVNHCLFSCNKIHVNWTK